MEESFFFLNLEGLDDLQVRDLQNLLHPSNCSQQVEFPWSEDVEVQNEIFKGKTLNVYAPAFELNVSKQSTALLNENGIIEPASPYTNTANTITNGSIPPNTPQSQLYISATNGVPETWQNRKNSLDTNGNPVPVPTDNAVQYPRTDNHISNFKLNPTVSSFVPQNKIPSNQYRELNGVQNVQSDANHIADSSANHNDQAVKKSEIEQTQNIQPQPKEDKPVIATPPPVVRSWAEVVKRDSGQKSRTEKVQAVKPEPRLRPKPENVCVKDDYDISSVAEDKLALTLGKYLYQLELNFQPVFLEPRGLINRRNWCYINATLQALLACPPFYTLLKNMPLASNLERGKSCTPVIDSMVKVSQEFVQYTSIQQDMQTGQPFQPDIIYEMLKDLKSDCLKGQQEDAEEFLSFVLNGMHEEMVKIIKHFEKTQHLNSFQEEMKVNGDVSDNEEEWQVIGSKHKGMVIRKVAEHKTPISDLLGGQIKSFLTTCGNKTSASVQPFFTLQLDIQSETVTSVSEALSKMTLKEPIQGYTCAKTRQEIEAYSHVSLQKLPPVLILHLKRFIYDKNGGCKKVMKKTDYPIQLELKRELFSPEVKRMQRCRFYKLFAVMYHDGEEAVKGHYVSDVYNHGSQGWIRCDDRTLSPVTEAQVLSHSPPRVPYLLFYQLADGGGGSHCDTPQV